MAPTASSGKEMTMVAVSYQLHSLLVARLGVLAEFQQKMASLQSQADVLVRELFETAPQKAKEFLIDEMVIDNLVRYGQSSVKIVFGTYGFADGPSVIDGMRQLAKAWEENIAIKVHPAEGHRIEVSFTPRTPFA